MNFTEFFKEHESGIILLGFMIVIIIIGFIYMAALGINPFEAILFSDKNIGANSSVIMN